MTKQETITILAVLKLAYPQFYKGMAKEEAENLVALWYELLQDEKAKYVGMAVKWFISTDISGFAPTIGMIKSKVTAITNTIYYCTNYDIELSNWSKEVNSMPNSLQNAIRVEIKENKIKELEKKEM